jgi:hypothetical protein
MIIDVKQEVFLIIYFLVLIQNISFSQGSVYEPKLTLASPDASSLGRYGDISVNLYTGQPSIEVPLFQAKLVNNFNLPITLTYGSNGFNPNAEASNIGLGWDLHYGGTIVRSIRYMDDLNNGNSTGYANIARSPEDWYWNYQVPQIPTPENSEYESGKIDQEPDIFIANYFGRTIKFILRIKALNGGVLGCELLEKSDLKIKCIPNTGLGINKDAVGFEITDESGIRYVFKTTEYSTTRSKSQSCTANTNGTGGTCSFINSGDLLNPSGTNEYNTAMAWYLDTVIMANNEKINFEYDFYGNGKVYNSQSQVMYAENKAILSANPPVFNPGYGGNVQVGITQSFTETGFLHAYIKKISSSNGSITFETTDRSDIAQANPNYNNYFPPGQRYNPQKITQITFKNGDEKILKTVQFNQDYFNSGLTPAPLYERLKLISVDFLDASGTKINSYTFKYNEPTGNLPAKNTTDIDHWGYYNNKGNSSKQLHLIPTHMTSYVGSSVPNLYLLPGANREADEPSTKLTLLSKIIYPTGGETLFDWEQNSYRIKKSNQVIIDQNGGSYYSDNTISKSISGCAYLLSDFPGDYIDQTFTLNGSSTVTFNTTMQCIPSHGSCTYLTQYGNTPYLQILRVSDNFLFVQHNCNEYQLNNLQTVMHTDVINLDAGNYIVRIYKLFGGFCSSCSYSYYNSPIVTDPDRLLTKNAGGLRIKSIITKDNVGSSDLEKYYKYATIIDSQIVSSGRLVPIPTYTSLLNRPGNSGNTFYIQFVSGSPKISIESSAQGNYLGYDVVDEEFSNSSDKYIISHKFKNFDADVLVNDQVPGLPNYTFQNVTGSSLEDAAFDKTNAVVKQNTSEYYTFNSDLGLLINQVMLPVTEGYLSLITPYHIFKTRNDLKKTTEILFSSPGLLNTQTEYTYGSDIGATHNLLVKKKIINSNGHPVEEIMSYPPDISSTGKFETGRQKLVEKNQLSVPLQEKTVNNGNQLKYLERNYEYDTASDIVNLKEINSRIKGNPLENEIIFDKCDDLGNILQVTSKSNPVNSFIYGNSKQYPLAQVINGSQADIAYTSFETDGNGNWSYPGTISIDPTSPTGTGCYSLSTGAITKAGLTSGTTFIVSYWSKSPNPYSVNGLSNPVISGPSINGWTYFEHEVTASNISISGTGYIDELRLYSKGAQMVSYTYSPLIGITSKCDVSNHITYYEYDSFGRLSLIRDQDKNILKKLCYNYTGQAENCGN